MKVDLFHIGPPKTATTWVYHCLRSHPSIVTSARDRIHFFDIHYPKGEQWYHEQFGDSGQRDNAVYFDPTYSYVCSPRAPERMAQYNSNAKLMVCLRNPVERAFSHYWHLKKTNARHGFSFREALEHYESFGTWVEHGFTAIGLERFLQCFPRESLHIMMFEDIRKDPLGVYTDICKFAGLDKSFVPESVTKKVNVAGARQTLFHRGMNKISRSFLGHDGLRQRGQTSGFVRVLSGQNEYLKGIPPEIEAELYSICMPEIEALEHVAGLDLSVWRKGEAA